MLLDYREKLEALRPRTANDFDKLIKINHELAQVQGELEDAASKQASLQQRVDTELLEVTITSEQQRTFWHPIAQSLREFSSSLSQGTAITISAPPTCCHGWCCSACWPGSRASSGAGASRRAASARTRTRAVHSPVPVQS